MGLKNNSEWNCNAGRVLRISRLRAIEKMSWIELRRLQRDALLTHVMEHILENQPLREIVRAGDNQWFIHTSDKEIAGNIKKKVSKKKSNGRRIVCKNYHGNISSVFNVTIENVPTATWIDGFFATVESLD